MSFIFSCPSILQTAVVHVYEQGARRGDQKRRVQYKRFLFIVQSETVALTTPFVAKE